MLICWPYNLMCCYFLFGLSDNPVASSFHHFLEQYRETIWSYKYTKTHTLCDAWSRWCLRCTGQGPTEPSTAMPSLGTQNNAWTKVTFHPKYSSELFFFFACKLVRLSTEVPMYVSLGHGKNYNSLVWTYGTFMEDLKQHNSNKTITPPLLQPRVKSQSFEHGMSIAWWACNPKILKSTDVCLPSFCLWVRACSSRISWRFSPSAKPLLGISPVWMLC